MIGVVKTAMVNKLIFYYGIRSRVVVLVNHQNSGCNRNVYLTAARGVYGLGVNDIMVSYTHILYIG